jgi:AraC-like DNA-binding protein
MARIDDAVAAIESREEGEQFSPRLIARKFGVNRTTLARRHQGRQASRATQGVNQQLLNLEQERLLAT